MGGRGVCIPLVGGSQLEGVTSLEIWDFGFGGKRIYDFGLSGDRMPRASIFAGYRHQLTNSPNHQLTNSPNPSGCWLDGHAPTIAVIDQNDFRPMLGHLILRVF